MKSKEGTRLVLQWRKPEETNGVIKKYVLHFSDTDGVTKTYTMHSNIDKDYLTYEVSLPDIEKQYKIKVSKNERYPRSRKKYQNPSCVIVYSHPFKAFCYHRH